MMNIFWQQYIVQNESYTFGVWFNLNARASASSDFRALCKCCIIIIIIIIIIRNCVHMDCMYVLKLTDVNFVVQFTFCCCIALHFQRHFIHVIYKIKHKVSFSVKIYIKWFSAFYWPDLQAQRSPDPLARFKGEKENEKGRRKEGREIAPTVISKSRCLCTALCIYWRTQWLRQIVSLRQQMLWPRLSTAVHKRCMNNFYTVLTTRTVVD